MSEIHFFIKEGRGLMDSEFDRLLCQCKNAIERFVRFKLTSKADADDVLQEVYCAAFQKFSTLKDKSNFKAWILSIARNKCNDYFRKRANEFEIPLDEMMATFLLQGRFGITHSSLVDDTLELLGSKDKQILYLYFFRELSQGEISKRLQIPLGTVKSRLHTAKKNFKEHYPYLPKEAKGVCIMKKLPEFLPEYSITKSEKEPFPVIWEELMGWFIIPRLGEKLSWAMYDIPSRKCQHIYEMHVTGKAEVHGIEGVELTARESDYSKKSETINRTFVAQLTDAHCRYLAALRTENCIRKYITFLDEDDFMPTWGFGENNCGNETHIKAKGYIKRNGRDITTTDKQFLIDIVGRYNVKINRKTFDTVCVINIGANNSGVVSEQYLDKNGRTILWRRFNRDDWAFNFYKEKWSEKLPKNECLSINGKTYVKWYECITDYIL